MCYSVNSMVNPPKKAGEYLFYGPRLGFIVDKLRFDIDGIWYLANHYIEPTLWFELPKIAGVGRD